MCACIQELQEVQSVYLHQHHLISVILYVMELKEAC